MPKTHYLNLQVVEEACPEVIRGAYKALAQKWHPDRNQDKATESERVFKIITNAYEVLSDPTERAKYDAMLREEREATPLRPPQARSRPHPAADAWRSQSNYGTDRKSTGAKQSASEPPNGSHTPPPTATETNPILRSVVWIVLLTAWYFVFGKQWSIVNWFNSVFGL